MFFCFVLAQDNEKLLDSGNGVAVSNNIQPWMLLSVFNIYKYIAKINSTLLMHFKKSNHAGLNAVVSKAEQVYIRLISWHGLSCISQWHVNQTTFLKIPPQARKACGWETMNSIFLPRDFDAKQYNISSNLT